MGVDVGMRNFFDYFLQNPSILIGLFLLYCFIFGLSLLFSGPKPGKNPFNVLHVKPVQPLVTDQNTRDKVLKQKFKHAKVHDNLDAIVIGSGMGGLSTAVLLAKAGKKVLVLEQHDQAGGCCHTFIDKGFEFDTGIHYIGKMYDGHPDKVLTDQLTGGGVDYPKIEEIYDIVKIGDPAKPNSYDIISGKDKLEKKLIGYFPKEETAIKKFMEFLQESKSSFTGFFAMKIIPKRIVQFLIATGIYKFMFKSYAKYHSKSLKTVLDEITDDEELKAVLAYCWGDYGTLPSKTSSIMHSALLNLFVSGGHYIRGGPSEVVFNMILTLEKFGGRILVKAPVQKILTDDKGQACGVVPSKSSFIIHAALLNHFAEDANYIRGGPSEIAFQIVQQIEEYGGKVLVKAPVQKIITNEHGRAVGVKVGMKGNTSCDLYAKCIISDAGISNTFLKLLPQEIAVKSSYYPAMQKVGDSVSFLSMFVGLEGTAEELGLKAQNIWAFTGSNVEEIVEDYVKLSVEDAAQAEVPIMFVSFPSAKDPSWQERYPGKSNLLIITICPYEWFDRWEDGKLKHRGKDYEGLKNAIGRQMLNQCLQMFPNLEDKVAYTDVGTPLSNKYYLGFSKGEMYGLDHTMKRFTPEVASELRPKTDIPGLYLTGQDIACCGFTGAMFGGMFCASEVLHRKLHKDLEVLVTEVRKQTQKPKKE